MSIIENLPRNPVVLIILDGFGANPSKINNGIAIADTPRLDEYFSHNSHALLQASGSASGLPDGQMGNSEVGHMTMGCGSVMKQNLVLINDAITDGSFFKNEQLLAAIQKAADAQRPIHLVGLVSDGGVHSHVNHLLALIRMAALHGVSPNIHVITDGRDCPPKSAEKSLKSIEAALAAETGKISSISGRYFAMDRDHRWERTQLAWETMVNGAGPIASKASEAIQAAYDKGETDEFIMPTFIEGGEVIQPGDQVICFNFRKDRPRQIVAALYQEKFEEFDRGGYKPVDVTCFTEYDQRFQIPYAFELDKPAITLSEVISRNGLKQLHCAETEKYAHVTFFFNGGKGDPYPGEDRCLIDSPQVSTYDLKPEMSAIEVADKVIESIQTNEYAFIVVNFANGDMVGHTAVREAIIKAIETLDTQAGRVMDTAREQGYSVLLTADHGNCDEMLDPVTGEPHTQHTVYPVPCLIVDDIAWKLSNEGSLKNVAPTVLNLMGLTKPEEMEGKSLLLGPYSS